MRNLALQIDKLIQEVRKAAGGIPFYIKGHETLYHGIKLSAIEADKTVKKLLKIQQFKEEAARSYQKWDEKDI